MTPQDTRNGTPQLLNLGCGRIPDREPFGLDTDEQGRECRQGSLYLEA